MKWIVVSSLCLFIASPVWAQSIVCSDEAVDIIDTATVSDSIDFDEALVIEELSVSIDILHTFIGDLGIVMEAPTGGTLGLFLGVDLGVDSEGDEDIQVTFDDDGSDFDTGSWTCECAVAPLGPGSLGDFVNADASGVWTLEIEDYFGPDDGTLEEWCLEITGCGSVLQMPAIACELNEDEDEITLTWVAEEYEEFAVIHNGDEIAIIEADSSGEHSHIDDSFGPGTHAYAVRGIDTDDGCESESPPCFVETGVAELCSGLNVNIPTTRGRSVSDLFEDFIEVGVHVELIFETLDLLTIELANPEGTSVILHDEHGADEFEILISYTDFGVPLGSAPFDCDCLVQPSGPGSLADLVAETTEGTWSLDLRSDDNNGFLDRWCLRLFGGPTPSDDGDAEFLRGDADGDAEVSILVDTLFILNYAFTDGDEPPCLDAADVDGNGDLFPLIDALFLLLYGFDGGDAPPDPGPTECGPGDDDAELGCLEDPFC